MSCALIGDDRSAEVAINQAKNRAAGHAILTREQEVALAKRIERGDIDAKNTLIEHNVRLAYMHAQKWKGVCKSLAVEDLELAALEGVIRAADKFDWRKGFKFSTYAVWWIRQSIQREIYDKDATIRVPAHMIELRNKQDFARRKFLQQHHRQPKLEELAELAGCSVTDIILLDQTRSLMALDASLGEDANYTLADIVPDDGRDVEDLATGTVMSGKALDALARLPELEQQVIESRFLREMTLKATAEAAGVSIPEARAAEHRALKTLSSLLSNESAGNGDTQPAEFHPPDPFPAR